MSRLITRLIVTIVVLTVLFLSWYGAEMLLYGYSQPSIVDALIAVMISMSISGRLEKEMIKDAQKKQFAKAFVDSLRNARDGKDGDHSDDGKVD